MSFRSQNLKLFTNPFTSSCFPILFPKLVNVYCNACRIKEPNLVVKRPEKSSHLAYYKTPKFLRCSTWVLIIFQFGINCVVKLRPILFLVIKSCLLSIQAMASISISKLGQISKQTNSALKSDISHSIGLIITSNYAQCALLANIFRLFEPKNCNYLGTRM